MARLCQPLYDNYSNKYYVVFSSISHIDVLKPISHFVYHEV